MIRGFEREEFIHQPVEVVLRQEEELYALKDRGYDIRPMPQEQTIVISVGGIEYDVRDLIWRIKSTEAEVDMLRDMIGRLRIEFDILNARLQVQENRYY